jgi:ankyrin repeat protein
MQVNDNEPSLSVNIHLKETTDSDLNSVKIEGGIYSLEIDDETALPENIRENISIVIKEGKEITFHHFYSKVLNITEEQIAKIQQTFMTKTSDKKTNETDELLESLGYKSLKNHQREILNSVITDHNIVCERYRSVQNEMCTNIFSKAIATIQLSLLEKQLITHKTRILHELFALHQVTPVVTDTERKEEQKRINHLIKKALEVNEMAYLTQLIKVRKPTPKDLYYAVTTNSAKIIDLFVQNGCDPNEQFKNGYGQLQIACLRGKDAEEAIHALVKNGALLDKPDGIGRIPIMMILRSNLSEESILKLLSQVSNPNIRNKDENTLIHAAIMGRNISGQKTDVLRVLLQDMKANPNCKNNEGMTPLHVAVDDYEAIKLLLEAGAAPTVLDHNGQTP